MPDKIRRFFPGRNLFVDVSFDNFHHPFESVLSGGEEFAVVLPNTPLNVATRLAEKIRKIIEELNKDTDG